MKIPVIVENWPANAMPKIPSGELFVTNRKTVGNKEYGFGQSAVEINGQVWINELYVRERK